MKKIYLLIKNKNTFSLTDTSMTPSRICNKDLNNCSQTKSIYSLMITCFKKVN